MTSSSIGSVPTETLLGLHIDLATKLRSGARTVEELTLFLQGRNPFEVSKLQFGSAWKTLPLGKYKGADKLRQALINMQCKLDPRANSILSVPDFPLITGPNKIELVAITGKELGFTRGIDTVLQVIDRATSPDFNLMVCPAEVGPQLRLAYANQPRGEMLFIGMNPVANRYDPAIFTVQCSKQGQLELGTCDGEDRTVPINETHVWVFQRRAS